MIRRAWLIITVGFSIVLCSCTEENRAVEGATDLRPFLQIAIKKFDDHQHREAISSFEASIKRSKEVHPKFRMHLAAMYQLSALSESPVYETKHYYYNSLEQLVVGCSSLTNSVILAVCDSYSAVALAGLGEAGKASKLLEDVCDFQTLQDWVLLENCSSLHAVSKFETGGDVHEALDILNRVPQGYWRLGMDSAELYLLSVSNFELAQEKVVTFKQQGINYPVWNITLCDGLARSGDPKALQCYERLRDSGENFLTAEIRYVDWSVALLDEYGAGEFPVEARLKRAAVRRELVVLRSGY